MKKLIPYTPAGSLFFPDLFGDDDFFHSGKMSLQFPKIDMEETEKNLIVKADLPEMQPDEIDIQVDKNVLTLSGSQEQAKEEKGKKYHFRERGFNEFHRQIALPKEVDEENVKANMKNGVLIITLPKKSSVRRKIEVKSV